MREIGTPKIGSQTTNWHIKRHRITAEVPEKRPFLNCGYAKSQI